MTQRADQRELADAVLIGLKAAEIYVNARAAHDDRGAENARELLKAVRARLRRLTGGR